MKRQARVQLEMGGKNPLVVLDDADLDRAVMVRPGRRRSSPPASAARPRAGSSSPTRIHDRFVAALAEKVAALEGRRCARSARPRWARRSSEAQIETSYRYIDIAKAEGGRLVTGGGRLKLDTPGCYMQPTLIADTDARHADQQRRGVRPGRLDRAGQGL